MYKVDATGMQLLLGYSDVFGEPAPNLIEEIGKINMHKTLSIIAELIGIRNVKLNPIRSFYCEISIPFEMAIKKEILGIDERLVNGLPSNPVYRKDWHIISLQMFLIFLKKILIYGDYSTLSKTDYSITKEDYAQIIRLQLSTSLFQRPIWNWQMLFSSVFSVRSKSCRRNAHQKKSLGRNAPRTISPAARLRAGRTRRMTAHPSVSSFSLSAKSCPVSNRVSRPEKKHTVRLQSKRKLDLCREL